MANSDPHGAIAIDRLHMNSGGNTSDHLLPRLQDITEGLEKVAMGKVDAE